MKNHNANEQRKKEGDARKGLPNADNAYEEDDHPARDNPNEHGEIPRTRDDSKDHKQDPYKDQ
ncbi:hypothetical protein [Candidatus Pantoea multigeneris]|uniref:Uncharacterized protein n=1 Tax=Candidatus Pantoea multigeneris TaxID=2608357 RepID=A0ABX0RKK3_9GAMM|nr:hypothetical protein [Pantoea multigeneris]NIF23939.1 hypothetical protein [Pantoea multigeneris]